MTQQEKITALKKEIRKANMTLHSLEFELANTETKVQYAKCEVDNLKAKLTKITVTKKIREKKK